MALRQAFNGTQESRSALVQAWRRVISARLGRSRAVLAFAARRAGQARLTQVAASLTFTTVLSLVPLLAVALAVFAAFPQFGSMRLSFERGLLQGVPDPYAATILRYLSDFSAKASKVGAMGLAAFVVTALTMVMTVDQALNDIWHVRARRSVVQRILVYWALITAGPLLVALSFTFTSMVSSTPWVHMLPAVLGPALSAARIVFSCLIFSALYLIVPNTHVDWRDALTGGIVAGALGDVLGHAFAAYIFHGSVLTIYGAFAVVPIFLLWVYFSWLNVLFGAAIAATVSGLRSTRYTDELRAGNRFITAVGLLKLLMQARREGPIGEMSTRELAMRVRGANEEVSDLLVEMEKLGYVRQLAPSPSGRPGRWLLVCDPAKTGLAALFHRIGVDPDNSLLSRRAGLGLDGWLRPGLQGAWLHRPLAELERAEECPSSGGSSANGSDP